MTSRLECGICFHEFDDFEHLPKLLKECNHTFCYTCLECWLGRPETNDRDTCPMCRRKIDVSVEIPTNHKLLALYEKRKTNPKCTCHERRDYYCPMCMSQNYAEWEERLEDGEHTFCIGCACNHADDSEHQVVSVDGSGKPVTSTIAEIEDGVETKMKQTGGRSRKIAVAVALIVALLSASGLAIIFCQFI